MSVLDCLKYKAAPELKQITRASYEALEKEIKSLEELQSSGVKDVSSELKAATRVADVMKDRLETRVKALVIHSDTVSRAEKRIADAFTRNADKDPKKVLDAVLDSFTFDDEANAYKYGYSGPSAHGRIKYWQDEFGRQATDIIATIDKYRVGENGTKAFERDVVREIAYQAYGIGKESTNADVRKVASMMNDLSNTGGKIFKEKGGNLTLRNHWFIGLSPDIAKLIKIGPEEFVSDMMKWGHKETLLDAGVPPEGLWHFYKDAYISKVTGGRVSMPDYMPKGLRSVVNSRNHSRLLQIADGDNWIKFHEKYGQFDLASSVYHYTQSIGKDIGILEAYGPKPEALMRTLLRKAYELDPIGARALESKTRNQFMYLTGQWDRDTDPAISRLMANYRSLSAGGMLGMTVAEAAVGDTFGLNFVPKLLRGMPALKTLARDLAFTFKTGFDADREMWARLGWNFEAFADYTAATMRSQGAGGASPWADSTARFVMTWTGLNRKTWGTRGANFVSVAERLADMTNIDAHPKFKTWLETKGITAEDFKIIREHGVEKMPGADFNVVSVAKLTDSGYTDLAGKVHAALSQSAEIASPTSSGKWAAKFAAIERSGRGGAIVAGSAKTFTGYLSSYWENHYRAVWNMPGMTPKLALAAQAIVILPMFYTISGMIRDMLKGKEPSLTEDVLRSAFARSNVLPIIGDFLFTKGNVVSGSFTDRLAGVALSMANDGAKALTNAAHGKFGAAGLELFYSLKQLVPMQSGWYTNIILQRGVFDFIQNMIDSDAQTKFKSQITKARKSGSPYYIEPGTLTR